MTTTQKKKNFLRKKLRKYFNSFIRNNTFSLKELETLSQNSEPFKLKEKP